MIRTKYLTLIVASFLTIVATGCIVSVSPERAVNPVGTEHTVTVTLDDEPDFDEQDICEIYVEILEELVGEEAPEDVCEQGLPRTAVDEPIVNFQVIQGPNSGLRSESDGECEPSCAYPDEDNQISWTYQSNGVGGTDVIQVCQNPTAILLPILLPTQEEPTEEEFERIILDAINRGLGTNYRSIEDVFCEQVTKTWQEPSRPNIGAGLSGLFQGQPTPLPTAAAPAPAAPSPVIRPPSTGDAGLK